MPLDLSYTVTIGSQQAGSNSKEGDRLLKGLSTRLGMDGGCGCCIVELADVEYEPPLPGDALTVELDGGDGPIRVFTGEVDTVKRTAATQCITAFDSMIKLGQLEIESAYEEMTITDIVGDMIGQAGIAPGKLDECPGLPSFIVFKGPGALHHVKSLARLCGRDVYSDGQGEINFTGPETTGKEHSFEYGLNVLEVALEKVPALQDSIEVLGEGAAGAEGADKYFWLTHDLSSVQHNAEIDDEGNVTSGKSGDFPLRETQAILRSGEAVETIAQARMKAVAARLLSGFIKVYGSPAVMPGDRAVISGLPDNYNIAQAFSGGKGLRVRNVRHQLNLQSGFITFIEF
ncbi:MAG: hypothetical protein OEV42_04620 [Deltaproteobacteria bacterium]|nr:hypothetical protein [Deltaproteobacteria bacterium]